jgi:prefoldin subunit 5
MMDKVLVNVGDLTKMATTMKQAIREVAGYAGEVRRAIGVERGRIDDLSGFVLPRLGVTSAKVDEVRKQMAEHREYCSAVLRELRGYATAGFHNSRDMGVGGMQNVAAEGEDSDTGTADLDEMTAAMQGFQEEMRVLQETVDNIGAEVQWVAQGREAKAQNLQGEVEGMWGKIAELQQTAEELQGITGDLRDTVEGSELQVGATVVLHDLVKRADLNFQLGFLGVYDATKGRWAVELGGLTERMWVKGENLWAENGMRAKINLVEHILDGGKPGLL